MHLIELGLGNYITADTVTNDTGAPGVLIRVAKNHDKEVGSPVEGSVEQGWQPGDTVITFANKVVAVSFLRHVQEAVDKFDKEGDDSDDCDCWDAVGYGGCQGESSIELFEVPAAAQGSDENGPYRLIQLGSMPKEWSHLRLYQNGETVVVNKDATERPATQAEVLGITIFLATGQWSYVGQPEEPEYPKYVVNNKGGWDIAYIEQTEPTEWSCVGKDRTRSEMMPGASRLDKARMFKLFIRDGSWRYVTKAEAVSRLEPQS